GRCWNISPHNGPQQVAAEGPDDVVGLDNRLAEEILQDHPDGEAQEYDEGAMKQRAQQPMEGRILGIEGEIARQHEGEQHTSHHTLPPLGAHDEEHEEADGHEDAVGKNAGSAAGVRQERLPDLQEDEHREEEEMLAPRGGASFQGSGSPGHVAATIHHPGPEPQAGGVEERRRQNWPFRGSAEYSDL